MEVRIEVNSFHTKFLLRRNISRVNTSCSAHRSGRLCSVVQTADESWPTGKWQNSDSETEGPILCQHRPCAGGGDNV